MAYARNDFVPGDVIFFEDDLANEKLGEFPSQWDLDRGNAEVATINGEKCISLIGYTILMPLMSEKNYLPDEFTIEYDVFVDSKGSYYTCEMGFNDSRTFIGRHVIYDEEISFNFNWVRPDGEGGSNSQRVSINKNSWNHISISFNKRALKYYVNGVRVLNVPNMKQPTSVWIWADNGDAYYKNFRFAKGAVPLYDRMLTDGKFITYGITFDVGKSTIKPESMGEINRIVTLMTENPELKFSVEGHTDSTGAAASNQTLSESRSQAVVDKLVENGIARDRLTAAGKGQTAPIADNGTDEGRAKNRRVEFVKI
jgi:outer membrane protein OmpA-like peptidoglycan-associated protein